MLSSSMSEPCCSCGHCLQKGKKWEVGHARTHTGFWGAFTKFYPLCSSSVTVFYTQVSHRPRSPHFLYPCLIPSYFLQPLHLFVRVNLTFFPLIVCGFHKLGLASCSGDWTNVLSFTLKIGQSDLFTNAGLISNNVTCLTIAHLYRPHPSPQRTLIGPVNI